MTSEPVTRTARELQRPVHVFIAVLLLALVAGLVVTWNSPPPTVSRSEAAQQHGQAARTAP